MSPHIVNFCRPKTMRVNVIEFHCCLIERAFCPCCVKDYGSPEPRNVIGNKRDPLIKALCNIRQKWYKTYIGRIAL